VSSSPPHAARLRARMAASVAALVRRSRMM
jgi:hypothetical protein